MISGTDQLVKTNSTTSRLLLSTAAVIGFTFLTALGAKTRILLPFTPVPITMQLLMVLLAGAFLGTAKGSLSQALYLAWGISGLSWFSGMAGGLAVLAGPTGGYLVGFVVTAVLAGLLVPKTKTFFSTYLAFFIASLATLFFGWLHLSLFVNGSFAASFKLGVLPFLVGDVLKVAAATAIYRAGRSILAKRS